MKSRLRAPAGGDTAFASRIHITRPEAIRGAGFAVGLPNHTSNGYRLINVYPKDILFLFRRSRVKKILINIPEELLEKVDRKAKEDCMSRSEAVRWALRAWLNSPEYAPPMNRPGYEEIKSRMMEAARMSMASEPAEVLIRKDRESH